VLAHTRPSQAYDLETMPTGPTTRTPAGTGLALVTAGGLLCATVAVVTTETAPDHRGLVLVARLLGVALPFGLGAVRLSRHPRDRFGWLLIGAGALWALTSLADSGNSTLYSTGRLAAWLIEPVLVYLMLAFPYGRLTSPLDRRLVASVVAVAAVLYVPTALVVHQYPVPVPWASCGTHCPANAFQVGHADPAFVHDFVRPLREVLTAFLFAGVALALARRWRRSTPLLRTAVAPVAAVAVLRALLLPAYLILRGSEVHSGLTGVLGWIYMLSLPVITLCFVAGAVSQRLFVAGALERLTRALKPHATATELRIAMAGALADPELRIFYWVGGEPGRWVDESGWPVRPPHAEPGRAVTEVVTDGLRLAAIVHDVELSRDPALVAAATSYALTALENDRLVGHLHSSLRELSESRARIVSVADRERRRFERDLHDGAQQRLVALQIKMELMAERLDAVAPESALGLRALEHDVDETIDEVRSLGRGVYPALLTEQGLSEALRAAGRSAPVPTMVDAAGIGRYPPEVESTVYFACLEALHNAAKHAHGASGVKISVSQSDGLRFEVHDDGYGFEVDGSVNGGAGLTNIRDRLAAVGGTLEVRSAPGRGTTIAGMIPAGHGR
jgi:signal transduction histidine kinase